MGVGLLLAETERLRAELATIDGIVAAQTAALADRAARIATLDAEIAAQGALLAKKEAEFASQQAKLDAVVESHERLSRILALIEAKQARKNERYEVDPAQLPLPPIIAPPPVVDDGDESEDEKTERRKKNRNNHGRRKPQADLPHEPVTRKVDAGAACPICKKPLQSKGYTSSSRYEWVPGHWKVLDVSCQKAFCPDHPELGIETAHDGFALPRSIFGNGPTARVIVDRFADNIPLNRQVTRMAREGVTFGTNTLSGIVCRSAGVLGAIVDQMMRELLAGSWLQADATGQPVQDGVDGKLRRGHIWAYTNGEHAVYRFSISKHAAHPKEHLEGFKGKVLLFDGGTEFNLALDKERAGCMSHCRRKFFEARDDDPNRARIALNAIRHLFAIERTIVEATPAERLDVRQRLSKPVCDGLETWLKAQSTTVRPKSPIGEAIGYALRQWPRLTVFLKFGEIPIHNNLSELLERQPVMGRKTSLFAGSEGGAEAAAIHFSLIGSCMLQGVDPWFYLTDVLGRLDQPAKLLTPAAWHAAHARES